MNLGPAPPGTWSAHDAPNFSTAHDFLQAGRRYQVVKQFADHDGRVHPAGEAWTFLGCSFVPHDDGMSFVVSFDDRHEWLLRLQWRADEQAEVLDHLADYLAAL